MLQNNLSFKSENLVVDWISFNAKGLIDPQPGFAAGATKLSVPPDSIIKKTVELKIPVHDPPRSSFINLQKSLFFKTRSSVIQTNRSSSQFLIKITLSWFRA